MRIEMGQLEVRTPGRGLVSFGEQLAGWLEGVHPRRGLVNLFLLHTSASLLVQENADPAVGRDLDRYFTRLVPDGDPLYEHTDEGPDDMPAHVRAALTQTHLALQIDAGRLLLGTWQGLYVFEHRTRAYTRKIAVQYLGE